MIRSICLNPAIDRVYYIDSFKDGKQYRDNVPQIYIGGKGINVAKACAALRENVTVYGFLGGKTGELVSDEMFRCGCKSNFIEVDGETRTTINIIDHLPKKETEIIEKGPTVSSVHIKNLRDKLENDIQKNDVVICSGLSIPGAPQDIYIHIGSICKKAGAKCFLDTNGENLRQSIKGEYYLFKPNRQELLSLNSGGDEKDINKIREQASALITESIKNVLVSLGKNGALFVSENVCYKIDIPTVNVINTIGCGDCSVAGYAAGIVRGYSLEATLRLSMACGVANSIHAGICEIEPDSINGLMEKIILNKV
jgi:tagatose 6-phosphate kinase